MNDNLTDKTILITGANSGIGRAAALQLAEQGANVVMACRSMERGEQARQQIINATGNPHVELMQLDLASRASICQFADAFLDQHKQLHVLIHNAANFDHTLKTPVLTEEGIETIFATNHVGTFLLTHLLLDVLKASAPSRIITVASKGLTVFPNIDIQFDNLNGERKFSTQQAYYQSKLAQVMFTFDLAQRLSGTGVTVNCVRVTNVAIPDDRLKQMPGWLKKIYNLKRKMAITPEQQAGTYVYLAADNEAGQITGGYWDEHNHQVKANRSAYNQETWKRLWDVTAQMGGVNG